MKDIGYAIREHSGIKRSGARPHLAKLRGIGLACAMIALAWTMLSFTCGSAWADDLDDLPDDVPRTVSGFCHIGATWMVGEDSFFTVPSFSGLLEGGTPSTTFCCIDHTAAAPTNVDATYEGTISDYSASEGWVEYYLVITPPGVTDGVTRNELGLIGYQRVAGKVRIPWSFSGSFKLVKRSANASITKDNGCYSLEGAVYGVFDSEEKARKHDADKALATYKTNAKGAFTSKSNMTAGTYYVAETKAPEGYALDKSVYAVEIVSGERALVNADVGHVSDEPMSNPVKIWAAKQDAETADHGAQGSATLAGTRFEISYYDGYYKLDDLPSKATRTWVVTCAADGKAYARDDLKVSGDDFYRTDDGQITIPLGTVVVSEKKPPALYREGKADDAKLIKIKPEDEGKTIGVYTAPTFKNKVVRGGVAVGKVDRQTGTYTPQGTATLAGATFEIVTDNEQQVIVDKTRYTQGDVVKVIETELVGGKYIAQTPADCLPAGSYTVRETASSQGYAYDKVSQEWEQSFEITTDGQMVDLTKPAKAVGNQVARGDLGFSKVDGVTDNRIGGVPFLVTSTTTGEHHVLMGDANGMASTAASWNAHTTRTNANDAAVTR